MDGSIEAELVDAEVLKSNVLTGENEQSSIIDLLFHFKINMISLDWIKGFNFRKLLYSLSILYLFWMFAKHGVKALLVTEKYIPVVSVIFPTELAPLVLICVGIVDICIALMLVFRNQPWVLIYAGIYPFIPLSLTFIATGELELFGKLLIFSLSIIALLNAPVQNSFIQSIFESKEYTPKRFLASFGVAILLILTSTLSVFIAANSSEEILEEPEIIIEEDVRIFVTDKTGEIIDQIPLDMTFQFSDVGETGKEPSIGVTSSGCIFFIAMEKVMRSCDYGESWEETQDPVQCSPTTSDPYGWVDPITDRIFNVQMIGLETSWICWSDDDGETWIGNPHDSGTTPINDHIKLASGPWTTSGYGIGGQFSQAFYETAVYYCYNKIIGIFCFTSFDGGATFEAGGQIIGLATTNGGLHGAISTAPDGTVYVTPRVETPSVIISKDNGLTWFDRTMGEDVGTPYPRKNSEISTDTASNAYHVWTGADEGVYMSRSTDSGETWEQDSIRISPKGVISTVFPQTDAGDPGRIAITYLGSENSELLNESDIDGNPWDGNAHYAPNNTTYHLYITYSLNALDENPIFHTQRVTDDPVQIGSICLNSGDCRDIGGSNRNLLDFNDLHIDREGRVYVAFADGCTGDCATGNNSSAEDSRDGRGSVYYLASGPSLLEAFDQMSPLLANTNETKSYDIC